MKLYTFSYDKLKYTRKGKIATLTDSIFITLYTDQGEIKLNIKPGFRWNGNSGAFPCRFSTDNEKYNVAIFTHDVLYHRIGLSKAEADDCLRGMLREAGYGRFMAGLIHRAVTIFGRCAYDEDDEMTLSNLQYINISLPNNKTK